MKTLTGFIIGAIIGWFMQDWLVGFAIAFGLVLTWQAVEWVVEKTKRNDKK